VGIESFLIRGRSDEMFDGVAGGKISGSRNRMASCTKREGFPIFAILRTSATLHVLGTILEKYFTSYRPSWHL
jgi:hypothetical protein